METKHRLIVGAAGLVAGLLIGFVIPGSWIFVEDPTAAATRHAPGATQYACPMFCTIMDQPPEDDRCPVCGMEMTPVSAESTL
ncbi:MAG: hypothetical protein ACYS0F_03470, partial [Planctomycetota bacterium]